MDEPFGAVDPIARDRLQEEFLRLQQTVRKTVVFVTHDIEEAVRLGDRIAVMRQGGHLEQYGTPADLLGNPANDFVADFVGADRGLKRLAVTPIQARDLEHPPVVHLEDAAGRRRGRAATGRAPAGPSSSTTGTDLHGWLSVDGRPGGTVGDRGPPDGGVGARRRRR